MQTIWKMVLLIGIALSVMVLGAWAAEKSVSEKILDILKERDDISEQQYEELKKQAEESGKRIGKTA